MPTTIYSDDKRTVALKDNGLGLILSTSKGDKRMDLPYIITDKLDKATAAAITENSGSSIGWFKVIDANNANHIMAICPPEMRDALEQANKDCKARINSPAATDRYKITVMFDKAEKARDYPGDYYPMIQEAQAALKSWGEKYPEARKAEKRSDLISQAAYQDSLALGAMTFDADGSLTSEMQTARAQAFREQATGLRELAAQL